MGRVLDFHLCDPVSNPTLGSFFFFFFVFFFIFCLSRIRDNRAVRVKDHYYNRDKNQLILAHTWTLLGCFGL